MNLSANVVLRQISRCSTRHIERDGAYLLWGYPHLQTLLNRLVHAIESENRRKEPFQVEFGQFRPSEPIQNASIGPHLFVNPAPSAQGVVGQINDLRRIIRDNGDQNSSTQPFPSQKPTIGRSDGMASDRKKGSDASERTVPPSSDFTGRHAEYSRRSGPLGANT